MGHSIYYPHPPPPPIEGTGFLRGRGGGGSLNAVGVTVSALTEVDFLINSEGDVCRHFDFLFLGGQKFT